jgi:acetyl esterase
MADGHEIEQLDVEYLRHGNQPLMATIYRPRGAGPFPAVVEVHGGAWVMGDRSNNAAINLRLARGGVVVAALDFRCPPEAAYPGSLQDINYAIRWLKAHAMKFGTRPEMIGTMGTSSGGHLAVLVAMKPDDPRYAAIPMSGDAAAFDARACFVVTMWPVIDPLGRYRYIRERQRAGDQSAQLANLAKCQERYWGMEDAMAEGAPVTALKRGEKVAMPPIMYVQNSRDPIHPRAHLEHFVEAYRKDGGRIQLELFESDSYDVIRSGPSSTTSEAIFTKILDFIRRLGQ